MEDVKSYEFIKDGKGFAYDKNMKQIQAGNKVKKADGSLLTVLAGHIEVLEPFLKPSKNSIKHNFLEIV